MSLKNQNQRFWPNTLKTAFFGASLAAALGYYYHHHWLKSKNVCQKSAWQKFLYFFQKKKDESEESLKALIEEVKDKYLSDEIQEVLDNIQDLVKHVNVSDKAGKPYNGSVLMLLLMLERVQSISFKHWVSQLPNLTNVQQELIQELKYFSNFAFKVYEAATLDEDDKAGAAAVLDVDEEDILMTEFTDDDGEDMCPKFVLFIDHNSESLVLSVRGTKSIKDALLDMVCRLTMSSFLFVIT